MYDVSKYLNPPKRKAFYQDSKIVHDDDTRKSHDVTNGYDLRSPDNEINDYERRYTSWDSTKNRFVVRTVEADEYSHNNAPTGRRKHKPHYENRFRIDTSSSVFITRRKAAVDIFGASDELREEIESNIHLLLVDVTITLDEYHRLIG